MFSKECEVFFDEVVGDFGVVSVSYLNSFVDILSEDIVVGIKEVV